MGGKNGSEVLLLDHSEYISWKELLTKKETFLVFGDGKFEQLPYISLASFRDQIG